MKRSKLLLFNAAVGVVAVFSVAVYLIALLTNRNFKDLMNTPWGDDFGKFV